MAKKNDKDLKGGERNLKKVTARSIFIDEQIEESEKRYRVLFDLGPIAIYSCDVSGVIVDFNTIAVKLWGRSPKPGDTDLHFCSAFKLYRADGTFVPHELTPMAQVLSGNILEARDTEVVIERPDGSRVIAIVNIRSLKNQNGKIIGAINCFVDITKRKQAEEALRASEEKFRSIIESSHDCIKELDLEGRLLSMNSAGLGLLEIDNLIPLLNRRWVEFWEKSSTLLAQQAVEVALSGGVGTFEGISSTFKGTSKWWSVLVTPILDVSDKPVRLLVVSRDITKSKEAEKSLRESESRYQLLTNSMVRGFCLIEVLFDVNDTPQDFLFLEINPTFERQSGMTGVLGKTMRELVPGIEQYWIETFGQVALTGKPVQFENYVKELNRWFDINAFHEGKPGSRKIVCLFSDVSERKETQQRNEFLAALPAKLATATAEKDIIKIAVEAVGRHLNVDRCYFVERHEHENRLTLSYNWLRGQSPSLEGEYDLRDFRGLEWWRQYSVEASSVDDVSEKNFSVENVKTNFFTQNQIASYGAVGIGSFAFQPLRRDGELAVCLAVTEAFPRKWTTYEMRILDDVMTRIWPLVEHARDEQSLLESEERFRVLVTASSDAVYRMNPDWSELHQLHG